MPERKIGEVFYCEGAYLKVAENSTCQECIFRHALCHCVNTVKDITGPCSPLYRTDKKSVIFIYRDIC